MVEVVAGNTVRIAVRISVEFKDTRLDDALKEIKQLVEEAGAGGLSFQHDLGVSMNLTVTYAGKDQTLRAWLVDGS